MKNIFAVFFFFVLSLFCVEKSLATVSISSLTVSRVSGNSGNSIVTFLAQVNFGFSIGYSGSAELKVDGSTVSTVTVTPGTGAVASITFPNINFSTLGTHSIVVNFTGAGGILGVNGTGSTSIVTTSLATAEEIRQSTGLAQFIMMQSIIERFRAFSNYMKIFRTKTAGTKLNDRLQKKFVGDEPGVLLAQNEGVVTNAVSDGVAPTISSAKDLGETKLWFTWNNSQYKNNDYSGRGTATNVSNGLTTGITKILSDRIQGGGYVGYAMDQFKLGSNQTKTDIASTNLGAFLIYETSANVETMISAIYSKNDYDYDITGTKSSTAGSQLAFVADLKGSINHGNWTFNPSIGLDTVGAYINSYKDSANASFESQSVRTTNVNITGEASYRFEGDQYNYIPSFGIIAENHHSTANIATTGELGALAGFDVSTKTWNANFDVNYLGLNSNYKTWNLIAGVSLPF